MLSGPKETAAPTPGANSAVQASGSGVKTYTIDLAANPQPTTQDVPQAVEPPEPAEATSQTTSVEANRAIPDQQSIQDGRSPAAPAAPPSNAASTTPSRLNDVAVASPPDSQPGSQKAPSQPDREAQRPAAKPAAANKPPPEPKPAASATASVAGGAWAVQVASFASRAKSESIAADLKAKGYPAFVVAGDVKGQTMYRVRVGPAANRVAADALLARVKTLHPGAAVVAQ
jgi:DedD protein